MELSSPTKAVVRIEEENEAKHFEEAILCLSPDRGFSDCDARYACIAYNNNADVCTWRPDLDVHRTLLVGKKRKRKKSSCPACGVQSAFPRMNQDANAARLPCHRCFTSH